MLFQFFCIRDIPGSNVAVLLYSRYTRHEYRCNSSIVEIYPIRILLQFCIRDIPHSNIVAVLLYSRYTLLEYCWSSSVFETYPNRILLQFFCIRDIFARYSIRIVLQLFGVLSRENRFDCYYCFIFDRHSIRLFLFLCSAKYSI
jgi:hypothetical protein